MDPFSAIGFASNILSFVEVSWKLILEARAIYRSASGNTPNDKTIETAAKDVQRLCAVVVAQSPAGAGDLQELAEECRGVADELLAIMEKLALPKGNSRRLNSFVLALRRNSKKGDIDSISARLQKLQLQLIMRIQWMLRNESSGIATTIARIEDGNRRMGVEMSNRIEEMRTGIIEKLERIQDDAAVRLIAKSNGSPSENKDPSASDFQRISIMMHELSTRLSNLERSGQEARTLSLLLQSLHFDAIRSRYERIDEAHAETFQWVLESDPESRLKHTKFVDWLRGDRRTFWIRGKPGSGKSTLMKYLLQHPKLPEHLAVWSGNSRLVIARYFFWNSGTSLEKSQEGLLRALLFEVLRSFPELANTIGIARYSYGVPLQSPHEWNGLDEYKGDTFELLRLVQKLASSLDLKLCVSSRPWTEFMDAFGAEEDLVIKLEDLTQSDIHRYVIENLHSNQRFGALAKDQVAYHDLADEVVLRAQGVFLWVKLVVRSLIQGATYADSLADMYRRVEEFPDDLEAYFEAIVADIPLRYLQKTALTVEVMIASEEPLSLVMHYFIDEVLSDPDFALNATVEALSNVDSVIIHNQTVARLDARFKGLLEVRREWRTNPAISTIYYVHFIHRTAKDFLRTRFIGTDGTPLTFNPYSIISHSALATIKLIGIVKYDPVEIEMFLRFAAKIKETDVQLTKLDQAAHQIEKMEGCDANWRLLFLGSAMGYGWQWYVKEKITKATSLRALVEGLLDVHSILLTRRSIENGTVGWLIEYLSNKDAVANKDLILEIGRRFAREWWTVDFYSPHDLPRHDILCKLLANGLPLSVRMMGRHKTLRDYITKQVTPDIPYGPELLCFLEGPGEVSNTVSTPVFVTH
ncbi:hypothetical protein F5X98DRAFT_387465 [Xylaria grammica]|nr:hypothetical protein F5X98DRAFT_387465 [Xylaria grammica]